MTNVSSKTAIISITENLKFSNEWLKNMYSSAVHDEMQYRSAWVYVLDELEKEKRISGIRSLLDAYGHPVFIDSKGKIYAPKDQLAFLLAPYSLRRLLREKKADCALCQVCLGNKGDVVEECFTKLWRVKKPRSACIMRYYLYVMGLGETDFDTLLFSK